MKLARGTVLVLASHNRGKLVEIAELVSPYGLVAKGADALGLPEPEETGATFAENAALKARAAATASGHFALADDSGLGVEALGGAPGIYSARWAGPKKDFSLAMARVERELRDTGARNFSAAFVCALALAAASGEVSLFEGSIHGSLVFPPRGENGFGYDPIFIADGMSQTFGEIAPALKHAISHRARAFAKFAAASLP